MSPAASAIDAGGQSVFGAVRDLDDGCDRLADARGWRGRAHDAATIMFHRATDQTSLFAHYTEAVATALQGGSGAIGAARRSLLDHAEEVERGELSVSDMWVVLIKPARVSVEEAAKLQARALTEQKEINRLLIAVGDADDATAAKVQNAAKNFGFALSGSRRSAQPRPEFGVGQTS